MGSSDVTPTIRAAVSDHRAPSTEAARRRGLPGMPRTDVTGTRARLTEPARDRVAPQHEESR
ncbi:hypothetical protein [Saccharopolyspora sp. 5N708]|uniref:hypothetical protein n=1 Tax=Saccharopolyspora sp. 5N708 TaxID=3457424 RepID=UPI003FCF1F6A